MYRAPGITAVIRDFPDHATFREKSVTIGLSDKLMDFLSLILCNKANFVPQQRVKYEIWKKCETGKKCMDCLLFPDINHLRIDNSGSRPCK